ncbi:DUF6708 domain-containing protein [Stenotrophomonas maltophilia]|uniref:DUF6708 domain-containing protein n=1 Tax=Stenotrophomonas maltophilia TaxID=40324 RepID=UPI0022F3F3E1|nr:DUF6708 domain-containing protein [Stenotrophomonas maltophilia]MDA5341856.1 hypothetical protein [Stenotrophomonas maltophilia]
MTSSTKRYGEVFIEEWEGEEPFFDASFAKKRTKGAGQVGVAQPRRILSSTDDVRVHSGPSSSDVVLAAYENGILISGLRGNASLSLLAWFGFLPALGLVATSFYGASILLKGGWELLAQEPGVAISVAFGVLFSALFGVGGFSVLFRILVMMPSDFPVIFNRKTKDVWVAVPSMPSFVRIFELHPLRFERHSWGSLRPRTYRVLEVTAGMSSARWTYILTMVFGCEDDPAKVASEVNIGFKGWGDDFELLQLWEHIRRYMNDQGPALDQGEKFKTFSTGRLPTFPDEAMAALGRKLSEPEAWAASKP